MIPAVQSYVLSECLQFIFASFLQVPRIFNESVINISSATFKMQNFTSLLVINNFFRSEHFLWSLVGRSRWQKQIVFWLFHANCLCFRVQFSGKSRNVVILLMGLSKKHISLNAVLSIAIPFSPMLFRVEFSVQWCKNVDEQAFSRAPVFQQIWLKV